MQVEGRTLYRESTILQSTDTISVVFIAGGSIIKLLYRSSEDQTTPQADSDLMPLRCRWFSLDDIRGMMSFIENNFVKNSSDTTTPSRETHTGVALQHFKQHFEQKFNRKIEVMAESEAVLQGLVNFLHRVSRPFYDSSVPAIEAALRETRRLTSMFQKMMTNSASMENQNTDAMNPKSSKQMQEIMTKLMTAQPDQFAAELDKKISEMFPCVVVVAGSAWPVVEIDKNHKYKLLNFSTNGGRSFLGLSRKLLNVESFEDVIQMAAKGSNKNVDICVGDTRNKDCLDRGWYDLMPEESDLFSLGKLSDKRYDGSYTDNDIAAGLVQMYSKHLAQMGFLMAKQQQLTRVVYVGSFLNHELMRQSLQEQFY